MKTTESDLVHAVLAYCKVAKPNGVFWRVNTGAVVSEYKGCKRLTRFGPRGQADIQGVSAGRPYFIECKSATGRLSPAQIVFGDAIKHAGGIYIVARTLEDVMAAFG